MGRPDGRFQFVEGTGDDRVVVTDEHDIIACRVQESEIPIVTHGKASTGINQSYSRVGKAPHNFRCIILAEIIANDELKVLAGLVERRPECIRQRLGVFPRGDDD
jgi:hypothetical protein